MFLVIFSHAVFSEIVAPSVAQPGRMRLEYKLNVPATHYNDCYRTEKICKEKKYCHNKGECWNQVVCYSKRVCKRIPKCRVVKSIGLRKVCGWTKDIFWNTGCYKWGRVGSTYRCIWRGYWSYKWKWTCGWRYGVWDKKVCDYKTVCGREKECRNERKCFENTICYPYAECSFETIKTGEKYRWFAEGTITVEGPLGQVYSKKVSYSDITGCRESNPGSVQKTFVVNVLIERPGLYTARGFGMEKSIRVNYLESKVADQPYDPQKGEDEPFGLSLNNVSATSVINSLPWMRDKKDSFVGKIISSALAGIIGILASGGIFYFLLGGGLGKLVQNPFSSKKAAEMDYLRKISNSTSPAEALEVVEKMIADSRLNKKIRKKAEELRAKLIEYVEEEIQDAKDEIEIYRHGLTKISHSPIELARYYRANIPEEKDTGLNQMTFEERMKWWENELSSIGKKNQADVEFWNKINSAEFTDNEGELVGKTLSKIGVFLDASSDKLELIGWTAIIISAVLAVLGIFTGGLIALPASVFAGFGALMLQLSSAVYAFGRVAKTIGDKMQYDSAVSEDTKKLGRRILEEDMKENNTAITLYIMAFVVGPKVSSRIAKIASKNKIATKIFKEIFDVDPRVLARGRAVRYGVVEEFSRIKGSGKAVRKLAGSSKQNNFEIIVNQFINDVGEIIIEERRD